MFNIVVAGFGWWGRHVANRLKDHPEIRVAGVIEPNPALHEEIRAAGLVAYENFDAPLDDAGVDGVVLTTPNTLHEEQVIACAAAGKHVYCEKPLGLTAASARRSMAAVEKAGLQLGIGHERRFEPGMIALKKAIAAGELGTIMHAEAAFSHDKLIGVSPNDWRTKKDISPAAGMTAMGIHLSDLLIWFFGAVETVQAMTSSRSLGWETGDVVTVQLGFEAGMTATFSAVLHTPHFIRMQVFGTGKWVEVRNATHPDTPGGRVDYVEAVTGSPLKTTSLDWTDAVVANLESFRAAAMGEAAYVFTNDEMVHNIEVLEAISLSASDRRTVRIAELR